MAGSLAQVKYWAVRNTLCSAIAIGGRAVAIPGSDATSQDALDGAAVEPFEDHGARGLFPREPYILRRGLVRVVKEEKGFC